MPTLLVLKRFAKTPRCNLSLRQVLAKKLFEIKLQHNGTVQEDEFGDNIEQHGRELA